MSIWLACWSFGDCQVDEANSYHQIVMIYDGALTESGLYDQAVIVGREANGDMIRALWKSLDEFGEGKSILYRGYYISRRIA